MAEESKVPEQENTAAQEQTKSKRIRVTFAKNVKIDGNRYKKGDSLLLEKEKVDKFKEAGVIE